MTDITIRALEARDLEAVIALDRAHVGTSRRGFFEKRQAAMSEEPESFIAYVAEADGEVAGFLLAHLLHGEFGVDDRPVAVLDALGVAGPRQGRGIGSRLLGALVDAVRERGGRELRTRAEWNAPGLLDFFARAGFALAPRVVLERATDHVDF